jgi:hypothetical protein
VEKYADKTNPYISKEATLSHYFLGHFHLKKTRMQRLIQIYQVTEKIGQKQVEKYADKSSS